MDQESREGPAAHDHGEERDHDEEHDHGEDHEHDHHAHDVEEVGVAVLTVSSSRSMDDDPAGDAIVETLEDEGHEVVTRELVPDEYDRVQRTVDNFIGRDDANVVVTTGGTGVTPDDVTVEAVEPLLNKRLPGFGELFRRLSYEEVGSKVVGTCAAAGVSNGTIVFCLPGSESAVRLGVEEIIVEEAGHLVGLARRD
ncbi:molybdenum cofactor biosynthesis protein B [halophilic archaeon]|nr:molybdenum cofactor biosynthesis protein B [halophilic archaeon]